MPVTVILYVEGISSVEINFDLVGTFLFYTNHKYRADPDTFVSGCNL